MRLVSMTCLSLCLAHASAFAQQQYQQQPGGQPPARPNPGGAPGVDPNNPLDAVLLQWENKMLQVQSLHARVVREKKDFAFKIVEVFEGEAKYLKPNLAILDLRQRDKPDRMEKYISTGTFLYEFYQPNKEVRLHELPPPKTGQVADDNFLSFLFGMKAEEAKRRYEIVLLPEDRNYFYLEVLPRSSQDKADFKKARIALTKGTFLPRQLIFEEANNNQVTWDIPIIQHNSAMDRREFTTPALPQGWRMVQAAKSGTSGTNRQQAGTQNTPPRVVRPQQQGP